MSFEKFVPLKAGEIILQAGEGEIHLDDFFSAKEFSDSKGALPSQFKDCHYVTLYFDSEKKAIGVRPAGRPKKPDPTAYKVRRGEGGLKIRCPSFLWLCGISFGDAYRYKAKWDEKEGMLVAYLQEEI